MMRKMMISATIVLVCASLGLAGEGQATIAQTPSGVYLANPTNQAARDLLATSPAAMPERAIVRGGSMLIVRASAGNSPADMADTAAKLEARHGNVYGLAVNSGHIQRADTAVVEGGRVFLRASGGTSYR